MRNEKLKSLSPTAKTLYWFSEYKKAKGTQELAIQEASQESGIPISTLYKAARELKLSITRSGSILEL